MNNLPFLRIVYHTPDKEGDEVVLNLIGEVDKGVIRDLERIGEKKAKQMNGWGFIR